MRTRFVIATAALLHVGMTLAMASESPATQPVWQSLTDGKSLAGWTQRGGAAKFSVEDGQIVGRSVVDKNNSFLCTDRDYTDFVLEYEFKVDPRLNSGVQVRSNSVPGYKDGCVHGYQIEIDPTPRARTAGIYDEARRGWLADLEGNAAAKAAFKADDWNHVRVEARGDALKTWLNGVPAADLRDGVTRSGFIALQVHATDSPDTLEVRWRNLRIQDLGDPWRVPPAGATVLLGEQGDLSAWESAKQPGTPITWTFRDGYLEVQPGAGDIVSKAAFSDAHVHVEFLVDDSGKPGQGNGNSGVYLQRRYEVQILNSAGQPPLDDNCGSIYKVRAPDYNMARPAGQWQTYDIEFHAARWAGEKKTADARVTVYHNGTRIHDHVAIPGPTGAGQPEAATPGPLLLQDHGHPIRFRNIWFAAP